MKHSQNIKATVALALLAPFAARADWVNIFDLEDLPLTATPSDLIAEGWIFQDYDFALYPECDDGSCDGVRRVIADPFGDSENQVLAIRGVPEDLVVGANNRSVSALKLPAEAQIPLGGTGTYYFRFACDAPFQHADFFAFTAYDAPDNGTDPGVVYSHGNLGSGIGVSRDDATAGTVKSLSIWDAYSSGFWAPMTTDPTLDLESEQWYEIWLEITNAPVAEGGPYYNVYMRGGAYNDGNGGPLFMADYLSNEYDDWGFRYKEDAPITRFMNLFQAGTSDSGLNKGEIYFDDMYAAIGEFVVSGPSDLPVDPRGGTVQKTWSGYPVENDDGVEYVVTGDFIGTLVLSDTPWCYSYRLKKWIWIPEPAADASGGWTYVPR